jgi:uncharacterized membrane protein YdbT with pleckstrin-like domain
MIITGNIPDCAKTEPDHYSRMVEERVIFKGHPSAATILGSVLLSVVLAIAIAAGLFFFWSRLPDSPLRYAALLLLLIPLFLFLSKWVALKFLTYEITTERIKVTRGILSRRTDELELYRVKDTSLIEPFLLRLFGAGNILAITGDAGTPALELRGLHQAKEVREQLRASVEECRTRKGARVMEME